MNRPENDPLGTKSCPKLKNSSLVVEPVQCVLNRYVENGTVCEFSCLPGFKLYGDTSRKCVNGHWDNTYPACRRACEPLDQLESGVVTPECQSGLQDQGTICRYQCQIQHELIGADEVMCLSHGEWSYVKPLCMEVCPPLSSVIQGKIEPLSCLESPMRYNSTCALECASPFVLQGPSTITCGDNHTWSGEWSCLRGCEYPSIEHGSTNCSRNPVYEGVQCLFACDPPRVFINFVPPLNDSLIRVCAPSGLYNGSTPICGATCPVLNDPSNGKIVPSNCTTDIMPEGTTCKIECNTGFRFRGRDNHLLCSDQGVWEDDNFVCEVEVQFTLFNDDASPQVCGRVDDFELGALMKKEDLSVPPCFYLFVGSLWTWVGDMIKNVRSGFCMAVQDISAGSFSLILMKTCDSGDVSQQWHCEHEYFLKLSSKPLYLSASNNDHTFMIVKNIDSTSTSSAFMWKSTPTDNLTETGGACFTKLQRCPAFDELANGNISPASCKVGEQYEGTTCNITCDIGYRIHKIHQKNLTVNCLQYGAWRADASVTQSVDTLPPKCLKSCPVLNDPINGVVEPSDVCASGNAVYGTACRFKCGYAYELDGVDVLVCKKDGTWSQPSPRCLARCIHVPIVPGEHPLSPYHEHPAIRGCLDRALYPEPVLEGAICSYYCPTAMHKLSGAETRTCTSTSDFNFPLPSCAFTNASDISSSKCPYPPGEPDSIYACFLVDTDPDTERLCASYSCAPEYVLIGKSITQCDVTTWSWPDPPTCKRRCEDVGYSCTNIYAGEICYVDCMFGESFSHGNGILMCQEDGNWNDTVPTCVEVPEFFMQSRVPYEAYCLIPQRYQAPFLNAPIVVENCFGQIRARWTWINEYQLMHSASALCLTASTVEHGASLYLTFCDPVDKLQQWDCSADIENPMFIKSKADTSFIIGTTLALMEYSQFTYHACLVNPTLLKSDNLVSTKLFISYISMDGTLCAMRKNGANCPPLSSVVAEGIGFTPSTCLEEWSPEGTTCFWFCESGEESVDNTMTHCANGLWNSTTFACHRSCPSLDHPENGRLLDCLSGTKVLDGMTCSIECDEGSYVVGESTRVCQWDGSWSGSTFLCARLCNSLAESEEILIEPSSCVNDEMPKTAGMMCTYGCKEGYYMMTKENTRTCLEDGSWSGDKPVCVRVCPPLSPVTNGLLSPMSCASPPLPAGSICSIVCDDGYQIAGDRSIECLDDGTWSNSSESGPGICQSQCKIFPAPENSEISCQNDGKVLSGSSTFFPESTECHVLCDLGFSVHGAWVKTCDNNGSWSGEDPYCYPENQFLIFLSKKTETNTDLKICLAANGDEDVSVVDALDCDPYNPFQRWSWYSGVLLKSSGSGMCLGVGSPFPGQKVELVECNVTDSLQQWSCASDSPKWFLRMQSHQLYPDLGYATTQTLWMYDLDLYDDEDNIMWYALQSSNYQKGFESNNLRTTVCSMRSIGGICSPLSPPANGRIFPSVCSALNHNVSIGMVCSYVCDVGFKSDKFETLLTCQENGLWSATPPKCEGFCPPINLMPHMVIHPSSCSLGTDEETEASDNEADGILPGGTCSVSCEDGYILQEGKEMLITCFDDGRWSSGLTECKRVCPGMQRMPHAWAFPSSCFTEDQIQGSICAIECENGFVMDISPKSCQKFSLSNSTLDPSATLIEDNCTDETRQSIFVQKLTKLCMGDGSWSGDPVECVSVCSPALPPWHGQVIPPLCTENLVEDGTICTYVCDDGFMVNGDDKRICKKGSWFINSALVHDTEKSIDPVGNKAPTCQRYCTSAAQNSSYTFISPAICNKEKIPVDASCTTSCHSDFILVGQPKTTCLRDGTWDGTPAKCIKKCSPLLPLENGAIFPLACTTISLGSGATCTFSCLDKFALFGSVTTTCNVTGHWEPSPPECKRRCFPLQQLYNGVASPTLSCYGEHIAVGDICKFSCRDGFYLDGNKKSQCQPDGQWDVAIPKCIRQCSIPSVENATVECGEKRYIWGTKCKVLCNTGLAPSSISTVTCDGTGVWTPELPKCVETGIPMYIMQSLDGSSICLMENEDGNVVRVSKQECLSAPPAIIKAYQWRWLENFNIQNTASGRCISVHFVQKDEPVATAICDTENPLQWWECSTNNPFRLLLRDTEYSPSTYIKNSNSVVLQLWSDAHSYFSTLSLNTVTFSSLCSRRPGGACPPLADIHGGIVEPADECKSNAVEEGQTCGYTCTNQNAILIGDAVTQCLGNGLWMVPAPKCIGSCPMLDDSLPPHTYYDDPSCVFDDPQTKQVCTAKCLDGYEVRGNPNRTCLESGEWSPKQFDCRRKCPVIFGILDGKIEPAPCRSISCIFTCNPGHVLKGARVLTCKDSGDWDKPIPQCIKDAQFQIISLYEHSSSFCVTVDGDKPATKSICKLGEASQLFKWIQSSNLLRHTATGLCLTGNNTRWGEVSLAFCDENNPWQSWECGIIANSQVDSLRINQDGTNYYLDIGAESGNLKLAMELNYHASSHWFAKHYFSEGTVCSLRDNGVCPPLNLPDHAHLSPPECTNNTRVYEGLVCTVTCDFGYVIIGAEHATCLTSGKWSEVPVCRGVQKCEMLTFQSSSVITSPGYCKDNSIKTGETCHFSCERGFQLIGKHYIECLDGGMWSGPPPTCAQFCPALHLPDHGSVHPVWCLGGNNQFGTTCNFKCQLGFKLHGSSTRFCKGNGLWSGEETQCIKLCPALLPPDNGKVFPTRCESQDNTDGTVCQFQCNAEYGINGVRETICEGGEWANASPSCILLNACPTVISSTACHTEVEYKGLFNGVSIVPGSKVIVSCGKLCNLPSGSNTRVCREEGTWEGGTPQCAKMCPPVKVPFGALIRPVSCSYSWQVKDSQCVASCTKQTQQVGSKTITCEAEGRWSDQFQACINIEHEDDHMSKPFMIRQYYKEHNTHVCLKTSIGNEFVISIPAELCSEINLSHLWTWYNYRMIRSVSSGLCWTTIRRDGKIVLGLDKCSVQHTGQLFSCGDIESAENLLHLVAENMQVWNSESGILQLTSSNVINGLDWESIIIGENEANSFQDNNTMSIHNSVCRLLCGGYSSSHSGTFSSPGFPDPYTQNVICDWIIEVPNRKLYVWLHEVYIGLENLHKDGQCLGDHLLILDGDNMALEDSNVLGKICGKFRNNLGPFVGTHGKLSIRFVSNDASVTNKGFSATWDSEPLPATKTGCGNVSTERQTGRLVNGSVTEVNQVPWYASVISLLGQQHLCGATFIHAKYVLTAAHCVSGRAETSIEEYAIGYGASYQRLLLYLIKDLVSSSDGVRLSVKSKDGSTLVKIAQIHVHEEFDDGATGDIALIELAEESTASFSAACVPPLRKEYMSCNFGRVEHAKQYCIVAGWDSEKTGGETALHYIEFPVVSDHQCQKLSVKTFGREINTTSLLCGAFFDGSQQSICDGDDGSGLICSWNSNYYVVGVASFQLARCGTLNVPKYFVRVATYQNWIEALIENVK